MVALLAAIACESPRTGRVDGSGTGVGETGGATEPDAGVTPDANGESSGTTSAPDPENRDDAEVVAFQYEPVIACGQSSAGQLMLRNVGTTTWNGDTGYLLAPVAGGSLGSAEVSLGAQSVVGPGETWAADVAIEAPSEDGSYTGSWQMLRDATAFGAVATAEIQVDCSPAMPPVPDVFSVVEAVAAEHGHLLETNTWESCGEFIQRVLVALADDPEWGHVAKTAGEGQYSPADWEPVEIEGHLITGFSHDVIFHRAAYRQVDIIVNAAANSDRNPDIWGPASIGWGVIEPKHYRENNPWMAPVPP
jgi:hypothetical protein